MFGKKNKKDIISINGIEPELIKNQYYWPIKDFATLTGVTRQNIGELTRKGNSLRKLRSKTFFLRIFVEYEELFDFPFVITRGNGREDNTVKAKVFYLENDVLKPKIIYINLPE